MFVSETRMFVLPTLFMLLMCLVDKINQARDQGISSDANPLRRISMEREVVEQYAAMTDVSFCCCSAALALKATGVCIFSAISQQLRPKGMHRVCVGLVPPGITHWSEQHSGSTPFSDAISKFVSLGCGDHLVISKAKPPFSAQTIVDANANQDLGVL